MSVHTPEKLPVECLPEIHLGHSSHSSREEGVCLLEAHAWTKGLPHNDTPEDVCRVVRAFGTGLNDAMPDDATRDRYLKPMLAEDAMANTVTDDLTVMLKRGFLAADWAVRWAAPFTLALLPETAEWAEKLRALAPITDEESARAAARAADSAVYSAPLWESAVARLREICAVGRPTEVAA